MINKASWLASIKCTEDETAIWKMLSELHGIAMWSLDFYGWPEYDDVLDCIVACGRKIKELEAKGGAA